MERLVDIQTLMLTAGGRVVCARCTAKSKRTGQQCGRPALKASKNQKCEFHGGRGNSGPKTPKGKARAVAAHTKTGEFSNAAREAHARASARLLQLEDSMRLLEMTTRGTYRPQYPLAISGRKAPHRPHTPIFQVGSIRLPYTEIWTNEGQIFKSKLT